PLWTEHCALMGYPPDANPVIIRVIMKELHALEDRDYPRKFGNHPIVYEYRPPNRALAGVGEAFGKVLDRLGRYHYSGVAPSIGRAQPNTAGTLGGILRGDKPWPPYLVTCAHVLGPPGTEVYEPGPFEGRASRVIGYVRHWDLPP